MLGRVGRRPQYESSKQHILLRNHRDAIAAMDFITIPVLTFGTPYCFFVISHERR